MDNKKKGKPMNEVNAALSQPLHQAVQDPILLSAFAAQIQAREKVLLEQYIITPEDARLRATAEVLRMQGQIHKMVVNITKFVPAVRRGLRP